MYAAAKERRLLVRKADNGSHFEGDCWPGRSAWVDYLQPAAREYWASRFAPDAYVGSTATLYTWSAGLGVGSGSGSGLASPSTSPSTLALTLTLTLTLTLPLTLTPPPTPGTT